MSNVDRAETLIFGKMATGEYTARGIAQALEKAGLLAFDYGDQPPRRIKEWRFSNGTGPIVWTSPDSPIMVQRIEPCELTPGEAGRLSRMLKEAAEYSEGESLDW